MGYGPNDITHVRTPGTQCEQAGPTFRRIGRIAGGKALRGSERRSRSGHVTEREGTSRQAGQLRARRVVLREQVCEGIGGRRKPGSGNRDQFPSEYLASRTGPHEQLDIRCRVDRRVALAARQVGDHRRQVGSMGIVRALARPLREPDENIDGNGTGDAGADEQVTETVGS